MIAKQIKTAALLMGLGWLALSPLVPGAGAQEYARLGLSVRAAAMGGAATAEARGFDAFFFNPAGLAQAEQGAFILTHSEDSSAGQGYFRNLFSFQGNAPGAQSYLDLNGKTPQTNSDFDYLAYHTAGGFGLAAFTRRYENSIPVPLPPPVMAAYSNEEASGGMISMAWASEHRTFLYGFSLKSVTARSQFDILNSAKLAYGGFGPSFYNSPVSKTIYDAGVIMRIPIAWLQPSFAISAMNVGAESGIPFSGSSGLANEVNIGVTFGPMTFGEGIQLILNGDVRDTRRTNELAPYEDLRRHMGAELSFFPIGNGVYGLQLRTGNSQGYSSAGVGINFTQNFAVEGAVYKAELGIPPYRIADLRSMVQIRLQF